MSVPRETNDTIPYTAPPFADVVELNRRRIAAGYAEIDRLAVDGGPVSEPRPVRRRYTLQVAGVVCAAIFALEVVAFLWWMLAQ